LFKLFSTLESRLTTNFELKNLFLNAIILLYENSSSLMLSGSGDGLLNIEIIQPAFYWGLCCVDKELRKRYGEKIFFLILKFFENFFLQWEKYSFL